MAESKVNRDNYIALQGWMITELNLKGNELIIYACIYGFTQAENQVFTGSLQYLADWTNSTKQSVVKCLKSLVEKGHIIKKDSYFNGVKFCEYYATKFNDGMQQSLSGYATKFNGGVQQSLNNNINNNLSDNQSNNNRVATSRFTPPTVEIVKAYCAERKNNVDAQKFVDYYSSNGWMVGRSKMKDWKAAVRNWERNNFTQQATKGTNGIAINPGSGSNPENIF